MIVHQVDDEEFNANLVKMRETLDNVVPPGYDYTLIVGTRCQKREMVVMGSAGNRDLDTSVQMLRVFVEGHEIKETLKANAGYKQ
jgi:hypothetical protein